MKNIEKKNDKEYRKLFENQLIMHQKIFEEFL
jgi:hypothetical protein